MGGRAVPQVSCSVIYIAFDSCWFLRARWNCVILTARRFENFLLPRMAGNSQQGQKAVTDLCAQLAQRYPLLAAKS